jgi:hypothetical protein
MEVDLGEPSIVKEINIATNLMTKTKTRIETNIVTKTGTETNPFIEKGIEIDPTAKTKAEEVVSLVSLTHRNDYVA